MKYKMYPIIAIFILMLIPLSGCTPGKNDSVTTDYDNLDKVGTETTISQSSPPPTDSIKPTSTPLLTVTNTVTVTPSLSPTTTPCPGQSIYPSCYEVDVFRVGEDEPFLKGVQVGCGPSGAMVIRFNADIRVTRNLDLIREGGRQSLNINFACLSQIDYLEMDDDEKGAAASFYELKGPDEYYDRQWKKARLTFVDGTVWDNTFIYDNCCYQSPSAIVEGSMHSCFLPASTVVQSDHNQGRLNDFEVTKIVIRRKEVCP